MMIDNGHGIRECIRSGQVRPRVQRILFMGDWLKGGIMIYAYILRATSDERWSLY